MPWSVTYVSPFDLRSARSRARSGPPRSPGAASWCERSAELVELGARDLPLVGDHLGAEALVDEVVALASARAGTACRPPRSHLRPRHGTWPMCSTPRADHDVVDAGGDQRRGEVDGLLRRAALAVDRRGRRLDRAGPACSQALRAMLNALLAELLHAAGDHVLDLARRRCPARSIDLGVGLRRAARSGGCPCSSPSPGARARSACARPRRSRLRGPRLPHSSSSSGRCDCRAPDRPRTAIVPGLTGWSSQARADRQRGSIRSPDGRA